MLTRYDKEVKRLTLLIAAAVLLGVGTMSAWLYVKYFKSDTANLVTFPVVRADVTDSVKVRGKIAAKNTYELGFAGGGTVAHVYVAKGETVAQGAQLMSIDPAEQRSMVRSAEAALASSESTLAKLRVGYSAEEIAVTTAQAESATVALADARQNLADIIGTSYTVADSAVRNYADAMITQSRTTTPQLAFDCADQGLERSIETGRVDIESRLHELERIATVASTVKDFSTVSASVATTLDQERTFLGLLASAINKAAPSAALPQASIDAWKLNITTARSTIAVSISQLSGAVEKWRAASSALALATKELNLRQVGTRNEDIAAAAAAVEQAKNDVLIANERLSRTTLYAPARSVVNKLYLERGEVALPGAPAVALATSNYQIEADVSELDIVKITSGQTIAITLDAFPEQNFTGAVLSIDPEEIYKDGDTYYRVTFSLDTPVVGMRAGMSSDVRVEIAKKVGVLTVPKLALYERAGAHYVKRIHNGTLEEVAITTGISDGQSVEVDSGLSEGDRVTLADG